MLEALDRMGRNYRLAYSSESHAGLASAVRAGAAVTALAKAALPEDFRILGPNDGFPDLPSNSLGILRREDGISRAVESFNQHVMEYFDLGAPADGMPRGSQTPAQIGLKRSA